MAKVPGTPGAERFRYVEGPYMEIATAGRNIERLIEVLLMLAPKGQVSAPLVYHDAGCPSSDEGKSMAYCTCEIVGIRMRQVVFDG